MRRNNKSILIVFILLMLGTFTVINLNNYKNNINDYYTYINKKTLEKNKIKDDEAYWSVFSKYQDEVDDETEKILNEMLQNKTNNNMNILYDKLLDEEERNNTGIGVLKEYINLIDTSNNMRDFTINAIKIEKELHVGIFMDLEVLPDLKNTNKNIVYLEPASFDFGLNAYMYNDDDYATYRALCKQYQIKMFKLYGYDKIKARNISNKIYEMQKDIAKKTQNQKYYLDVENIYHIITKEELKQIFTNIDIDLYLKEMELSNQEYFSIADKENFIAVNSYLTSDNLEVLKEYLKIKILETYSDSISIEYNKLVEELSNKLIGIDKEYDLKEIAKDYVSTNFRDIIEKEYSKKNFTTEEKKFVEQLIGDAIEYYENEIKNLNWMSSNTKDKALKKLINIKKNIGYNENTKIVSNKYILDKDISLIENAIRISNVDYSNMLDRLHNNTKQDLLSQTVVNAYYNVQENSINFPCAFAKFINLDKGYYENLGKVGMIIGHEITHAFDANGAKFDENGNLSDWWTEEDKKQFNKLKDKVITYYSNYEINGLEVNGKNTVSENIADLGAINSIVTLAKNKGANNNDMKLLFESFASIWASEYNEQYQKLLILNDTHSPDKIRVNATLSSCDEFYKIYNIKKSDKMYISKKDRVSIW